jgi:hypothetical protein
VRVLAEPMSAPSEASCAPSPCPLPGGRGFLSASRRGKLAPMHEPVGALAQLMKATLLAVAILMASIVVPTPGSAHGIHHQIAGNAMQPDGPALSGTLRAATALHAGQLTSRSVADRSGPCQPGDHNHCDHDGCCAASCTVGCGGLLAADSVLPLPAASMTLWFSGPLLSVGIIMTPADPPPRSSI